jgi:hypothetical protein
MFTATHTLTPKPYEIGTSTVHACISCWQWFATGCGLPVGSGLQPAEQHAGVQNTRCTQRVSSRRQPSAMTAAAALPRCMHALQQRPCNNLTGWDLCVEAACLSLCNINNNKASGTGLSENRHGPSHRQSRRELCQCVSLQCVLNSSQDAAHRRLVRVRTFCAMQPGSQAGTSVQPATSALTSPASQHSPGACLPSPWRVTCGTSAWARPCTRRHPYAATGSVGSDYVYASLLAGQQQP